MTPPPFYFKMKVHFLTLNVVLKYGLNILLSFTQDGTNVLHITTQNIEQLFTLPHYWPAHNKGFLLSLYQSNCYQNNYSSNVAMKL